MTPEFVYVVLRNFCLLTALLLVLRNIHWGAMLATGWWNGEDVESSFIRPHTFPEWVIRAGSVLIALTALFALFPAAAEHLILWFRPSGMFRPFAFMSLVCIEILLVWRLIYFSPSPQFTRMALATLAILSFLMELRGHG